ncbi:hypothetical protein DET47_104132 [Shewanella putrefaciens]|nr:hypothetical protein DET47_104132 [Shewanella putrefaciens]
MSIINNANPGSDFRIVALVDRVLSRINKPQTLMQLESLCRPENLPQNENAEKKLISNIKFWSDLGLWEQTEEGIHHTTNPEGHSSLPSRMLSVLMKNYVGKSVMEGSEGQPLLRNLGLMLCEASMTLNAANPLTKKIVEETLKGHWPNEVVNSNVTGLLVDYLQYLGFLERIDSEHYCVDPTRAIKPLLKQIFDGKLEMGIEQFLEQLNKSLPILDGGSMRQEVEQNLPNISPLPSNKISASLTNALLRLERSRVIRLAPISDDPNAKVLSSSLVDNRLVSKVEFTQGAIEWR